MEKKIHLIISLCIGFGTFMSVMTFPKDFYPINPIDKVIIWLLIWNIIEKMSDRNSENL